MLSFLKNHPFPVEAFFESSLVLTFAIPQEEIIPLLPPPLTPDTFQDRWAFVAIALVRTKSLRPKGFPSFLGQDFTLVGYRVFVRYTTSAGKRLRGLYILKSETNRRQMELFGNLFTHYNYTTTDITYHQHGPQTEIISQRSDFKLKIEQPDHDVPLPLNSPFACWQEARRFAGPLPFTFTYHPDARQVLLIEGVRQHWVPQPVTVRHYHIGFLAQLPTSRPILANAFVIANVPYYWKKGKLDSWPLQ